MGVGQSRVRVKAKLARDVPLDAAIIRLDRTTSQTRVEEFVDTLIACLDADHDGQHIWNWILDTTGDHFRLIDYSPSVTRRFELAFFINIIVESGLDNGTCFAVVNDNEIVAACVAFSPRPDVSRPLSSMASDILTTFAALPDSLTMSQSKRILELVIKKQTHLSCEGDWQIALLGTRPDRQRQGHAHALIEWVKKLAYLTHATNVSMIISGGSAIKYLHSQGMIETSAIDLNDTGRVGPKLKRLRYSRTA